MIRRVGKLPEKDHLDDLLDDALAGTFPASDPTSSFVCERERPLPEAAAPPAGTPGAAGRGSRR
jgi:hypothetical protein